MALTLEQIRELVLEGESNRLDFKREQYRFVELSGPVGDKEKAKLLLSSPKKILEPIRFLVSKHMKQLQAVPDN